MRLQVCREKRPSQQKPHIVRIERKHRFRYVYMKSLFQLSSKLRFINPSNGISMRKSYSFAEPNSTGIADKPSINKTKLHNRIQFIDALSTLVGICLIPYMVSINLE